MLQLLLAINVGACTGDGVQIDSKPGDTGGGPDSDTAVLGFTVRTAR